MFPLVATAAVIVLGLVCLFWLTEWIPDRDTVASTDIAAVQATDTSTDSANTPDPDNAAHLIQTERLAWDFVGTVFDLRHHQTGQDCER